MRTRMFVLALSSFALLAGCAGQSQLKPSDGSASPIPVSFSNPDDPPKADGSEGNFWAFLIDAEGSITPTANKVDGVLESLKITAHPRSKESTQQLSSYTVCLVFELDAERWKKWQCSKLRVVNKILESGSAFTAENIRFSIPAGRQPPGDRFWLVIRVHTPNRDSSAFVYAHSQRGILVKQNDDR